MAAIMKFVGGWLGQKAEPEIILPGFFGLELMDKNGEVHVKSVLAQSPAEKAGLQPGDQINLVLGKKVGSVSDFRRESSKVIAGSDALLVVNRSGVRKEIKVPLGRGF
jgi:S1-C subfamily serine protease